MENRRPNIVFIIADDLTPAYHRCYGGPTPTPNIDRIAREGALFQQAHAVAPLCNPSRYAIFTGQVPGRAPSASRDCSTAEPYSIAQNANLEPATPSLAKILREGGYFTGHVGKWHSNFAYAGKEEWAEELGPEADLDDPKIDQILREKHAAHVKTVKECGGFDWAGAVTWGNLMKNRPKPLQFHNPGWTTDTALEFLDVAAEAGRPFYLHLANTLPHGPDPHKSFGADHRYTFAGKLDEPPKSLPPDASVIERMRKAGIQTSGPIAGINAGVIQVDDQVGAVRAKLESLGLLENTIMVYTGDHGIHGKGTCYLGGYHMPMCVRWPNQIPAGQVVSAPHSHVDFLPTLCEAAEVAVPDDHRIDGVSQLRLWKGTGPGARDFTYQEMGVGRAITKGRWRYITFFYPESIITQMENGELELPPSFEAYRDGPFGDYNIKNKPCYFEPEQLYDLERDPCERRNLAYDPGCEHVLEKMRTLLHGVTDTLPGPYRKDVPPFMRSYAYRRLTEKRLLAVKQRSVHPEGFDQEKIFNLNLPDPLARE